MHSSDGKATYCMIPTIAHSRKGKTSEMVVSVDFKDKQGRIHRWSTWNFFK